MSEETLCYSRLHCLCQRQCSVLQACAARLCWKDRSFYPFGSSQLAMLEIFRKAGLQLHGTSQRLAALTRLCYTLYRLDVTLHYLSTGTPNCPKDLISCETASKRRVVEVHWKFMQGSDSPSRWQPGLVKH